MSTPLILGFDTSSQYCAAALLRGAECMARHQAPMARGQAEHLMPLLEDLLTQAGVTWADLDAIGVGIGPGNFTGIRISVSAARGLALALDIPAVGVSSFDAIAQGAAPDHIPAVAGPRGQVYVQQPETAPQMLSAEAAQDLGPPLAFAPAPDQLAQQIAEVAAQRWHSATEAPAPLYIKAADAAPPRDPAPVILPDDT